LPTPSETTYRRLCRSACRDRRDHHPGSAGPRTPDRSLITSSFTTLADQLNAEGHGVIGEVRGRGGVIAIESVKPGSAEPNPGLTKDVGVAALRESVIVLTCGNVIRPLPPPLVIIDDLLTEALDILGSAISTCAAC
jgi:4-aminobutyrate aminotransferase / (S)-3-amino-2-methylpropionate transaminase / 5-aminovalerate transaminase